MEVARVIRAASSSVIGTIPGFTLMAATGPVTGEVELLLGVAGIALTGIGFALGIVWGWLGRPSVTAWHVLAALVLTALLIFGGMVGFVLVGVALLVLIGTRTIRR